MTSAQRRKRGILTVGSLFLIGTFILLGAAIVISPTHLEHHDVLATGCWLSGIVGLLLGVTACAVEDDGGDRPAYLASLVHGLAAEWRRPRGTS